jgi:Ca2+-transporting ATPase
MGESLPYSRTTILATLAIFELYNAYNSRSLHESVIHLDPRKNKKLIAGLTASLISLLAAIYLPFMQELFQTAPLRVESWAAIILTSSSVIVAAELLKRRFTTQL